MTAPGWKGYNTRCAVWKCGRLAEFSDTSEPYGDGRRVNVYYCALHKYDTSYRWRTLDPESHPQGLTG